MTDKKEKTAKIKKVNARALRVFRPENGPMIKVGKCVYLSKPEFNKMLKLKAVEEA